MKVFVRVQSEYCEHDSSRYRLAISEHTLIPSLMHQTCKDFKIVLGVSPMDPYLTKRICAFRTAGVKILADYAWNRQQTPRIEVCVGDDDFLCPDLILNAISKTIQKKNTEFSYDKGYVFYNGDVRTWNGKRGSIRVVQYVEDHNEVKNSLLGEQQHAWIKVRHGMNRTLLNSMDITGDTFRINFKGWSQIVVNRMCKMRMHTATAKGYMVYPDRSGCVAHASGSNRRKRNTHGR